MNPAPPLDQATRVLLEPFRYGKGIDPKSPDQATATRLQRAGLVNAVPTDNPNGGWWVMVTWTEQAIARMKVTK